MPNRDAARLDTVGNKEEISNKHSTAIYPCMSHENFQTIIAQELFVFVSIFLLGTLNS